MTASELRDLFIARFTSEMPRRVPNDVFSQADCDLLNEWLSRQIEARLTLESCEKLAAVYDHDGFDAFTEAWSALALRITSETDAEMQENLEGSRMDVPPYVDLRKFRLWLENPTQSKKPQ